MASLSSVSGLASGIQWTDLVDQIMAAEQARRQTPIETKLSAQQKRSDAWTAFSTSVARLGTAAAKLRDGSAFGAARAGVASGAASGRSPFSASAATGAQAGSYQVEVLDTARAEKLSGRSFSSASTALGASTAGSFVLNGRKFDVAAGDTLATVRDRINAANTGSTPTRVSATLLTSAGGAARLVLTSDTTGAGAIQLADADGSPLAALGLTDGTTRANRAADGQAQSFRFSSSSAPLSAVLGVSPPPADTTLRVGGKQISVNFATDSLASLADRINAAGGSASLREETVGSTTSLRLVVAGDVIADATPGAGTAADSTRALGLLGFVAGGRGATAQTVSTAALVDGGGAAATGATLLADLRGGVAAGDTFSFRGTRGDGTAFDLTYAVTGTDTLDDVASFLTAGLSSGGRAATASVVDGRIVLTDAVAGDSRLAFTAAAGNQGGGSLAFGASTTSGGFTRQVVAGSDARLRVDGVLMTRASNTVTDAVAGVTLNLAEAQAGVPATLTVERDLDSAVDAVQGLATAYNSVAILAKASGASSGPLAASGALRSAMASIKNVLFADVAGLASGNPYSRAALAGVTLSKTGVLEVDAAKLKSALQSNSADVAALFGSAGRATHAAATYVGSTDATKPGSYAVDITAAATRAEHTGSGLAGSYAGADDLTVLDSISGRAATVALAGKSAAQIAAELNAAFATSSVRLSASDDGGQLRITGSDYGSAASFTLSGTYDEAQLGFTRGVAYAGTDVRGTLGGKAATGRGQLLTGDAGSDAAGLAVRWTGAAGAGGDVTFALGVGGMFARAADAITRAGNGVAAVQVDAISTSMGVLNRRVNDVQKLLELKRESLTKQFTAMESALSRIQSQSSWLSSQIASLPTYS